jgi:predicted oxidoreductase
LQKNLGQPLLINQVELSLLHSYLIDEGIVANVSGVSSALATGTLDYCRSHNILIQAWVPLLGDKLFKLGAEADPAFGKTAQLVGQLAEVKQTSRKAIVLAWLLRYPAGLQPIVGSTKPERVAACALADEVALKREEWYSFFTAARGGRVP